MSKKVKDTELYDILGVAPDATDLELRKAYRKKAMQYHPDKNSSPEAEAMFKTIWEAHSILSDADSRAFYDKVGRAGMNKTGEDAQVDPGEIFANMFGGERFFDYIGDISLVKDFTSTMDVVMTPEEKAAMETAEAEGPNGVSATAAATAASNQASTDPLTASATTPAPTTPAAASPQNNSALAHHSSFSASGSTTPSTSGSELNKKTDKSRDKKDAKPKLTPEQKAKLDALEKKQNDEKRARIDALREKLIQRIRPFVHSNHAGEVNDPETRAFEAKIRVEAEDLKLESFGIELLHTIAGIYITKAGNFLKAKKFFGGGFLGRLKEKGGMVKEGWGLLGSAMGVQSAMQEMERIEQEGKATQEELEALTQELSGKMLLTTWKATRWEVINVLGVVVDEVLYEPNLSKDVALKRAKAIMTIGGIFKAVQADESDEERRELERLVMNAGNKKKKAEKEKEAAAGAGKGWGRGSSVKQESSTPATTTTGSGTPSGKPSTVPI